MIVQIITRLALGGAQQIVFELATRLRESGENVVVLTGLSHSGPEGSSDNNLILDSLIKHGIETRICKDFKNSISPIHDFKALIWLIRQLKILRPNIVHIHSSKTGVLGRIAGKIVGIPKVIFHVHGWSFSSSKGFSKWFYLSLERILSHLTDLYIFVCKQDSKDFVAYCRNSKIKAFSTVIYPGAVYLDPGQKKHKNIELRKKLGLDASDFVIGTIARLDHQKYPEFFFRFAADYAKLNQSAKFLWIGDGMQKDEVKQMVSDAGIQDKVVMPGYISDVEPYFFVFDIFCITSRYEGLPVTGIKALANEVPIVGFLRNGMIDLNERFESFFGVHFDDQGGFVEAVERARNFINSKKELIIREGAIVRVKWSMDLMCEKIFSLYK